MDRLSHGDAAVRRSALAILRAFGAESRCALAALIARLLDEEEDVRTAALRTIEIVAPDWHESSEATGAVPSLLEALKHSDYGLRLAAVNALQLIGDRRAVLPLTSILREDESSRLRVLAAQALGQLGDVQSIQALAEALADSDPEVRKAAIEVLPKINSHWGTTPEAAAALPVLLTVMRDDRISFRAEIIRALGSIRDNRALGSLIIALVDKQTALREAAARTLDDAYPGWNKTQVAQDTVPTLISALDGADVDVWLAACGVVAQIGPAAAAAVPVLLNAMEHPKTALHQAARAALRQVDVELFRQMEHQRLMKRTLIIVASVVWALAILGIVLIIWLKK
jgi:HEAT repeat protein